jgi:hypothetical protein
MRSDLLLRVRFVIVSLQVQNVTAGGGGTDFPSSTREGFITYRMQALLKCRQHGVAVSQG